MKLLSFVFLSIAILSPVSAAARKNVLLICIDDLRPELGCYGVEHIHSPNIDRLASQGRLFRHHYVQAPTCGASRFALLTGRYSNSTNHEVLFQRAKAMTGGRQVTPSLPEHFRKAGYSTVSIGKISHHPGGWAGEDWDDTDTLEMPESWDRTLMPSGPWKHPRGAMHGLADGRIRGAGGGMPAFESKNVPDTGYPDGLITEGALDELRQLAEDRSKPFFLAVGLIRPHLPFGAPAKYHKPYQRAKLPPIPHPEKPEGKTTWHNSDELRRYRLDGRNPNTDAKFATELRKHYAACVSYADAQVGRILEALEASGAAANTIVILWGDHGWHLGEHAIWGKHSLFEESLRSPLIIRYPGMKSPGSSSGAIVEAVDLFPTLCEMSGLPRPEGLAGTSLAAQLLDPGAPGRDAFSYFNNAITLRTATHRIVLHRKDGFVELYDHRAGSPETRNIAEEHPEIVAQLKPLLEARQAKRSRPGD